MVGRRGRGNRRGIEVEKTQRERQRKRETGKEQRKKYIGRHTAGKSKRGERGRWQEIDREEETIRLRRGEKGRREKEGGKDKGANTGEILYLGGDTEEEK